MKTRPEPRGTHDIRTTGPVCLHRRNVSTRNRRRIRKSGHQANGIGIKPQGVRPEIRTISPEPDLSQLGMRRVRSEPRDRDGHLSLPYSKKGPRTIFPPTSSRENRRCGFTTAARYGLTGIRRACQSTTRLPPGSGDAHTSSRNPVAHTATATGEFRKAGTRPGKASSVHVDEAGRERPGHVGATVSVRCRCRPCRRVRYPNEQVHGKTWRIQMTGLL